MELFVGSAIVIAWLAIVVWGAAGLLVKAKQTKDWEKWVSLL
jgi:low affinity Fe/Cu permease